MKKLSLLFALCALVFAACETNPAVEQNSGKLTLTSKSTISFPAAGGQGEITYTFVAEEETRSAEAVPVATTAAEWIKDITTTDHNSITFNVEANSGFEREAVIKVTYGQDSFQVMVLQGGLVAADVNFTATHMGGTYYGKFTVTGGQTEGYNYHIIMSDAQPANPLVYNGYTEYRFDIYADKCAEFEKELRIPVGTYTLDHQSSGRAGTIDAYKDCSYHVSANQVVTAFRECTLVVSEDGIIADITFKDGQVHHVEYHGSLVMEDYSEPTYADVHPISNLTETLSFDVTGGYMYAYFRGDWFGTGDDVWFMHMIEHKDGFSGTYLLFNFIVPKSLGGFSNTEGYLGEYKISDPSKELEWTFPAGRLRDDSQLLNAFYLQCANGQMDPTSYVPIVDGTIKVEKVEGNTVITIDGKDDAGNDVKGRFSGRVSELEDQGKVVK